MKGGGGKHYNVTEAHLKDKIRGELGSESKGQSEQPLICFFRLASVYNSQIMNSVC